MSVLPEASVPFKSDDAVPSKLKFPTWHFSHSERIPTVEKVREVARKNAGNFSYPYHQAKITTSTAKLYDADRAKSHYQSIIEPEF